MAALQDSDFRRLVEGISDYAIFMLDAQGHVCSWNAGAQAIKGYTAAEIIGRHFSVFYPPDALERKWPEAELGMARDRGRFEDEGWRIRKDGSRFWANVVITAMRDGDGAITGFAKVTRDLTERRRHEEALRQSEERFRLLVDGVKDYGIFMLDPEGYIASWNKGAQSILGYAAEEVLGTHFARFYPPELLGKNWPAHELEVARAERRYEEEGWRLRKDGTRFWANVVIAALHDTDGTLRGFAKVTRDLTERRRVEALEASEQQTNTFLAMLAHELRNPLAPIRSAIDILSSGPQPEAVAERCHAILSRQVRHMARLVDDLLDVGRVLRAASMELDRANGDICEVARRAVESVQPALEARRHRLVVEMPPQPVVLSMDATRIEQALVNLLNNAIKYTPEGGEVTLALGEHDGVAEVRVRDTGSGMAPEELSRVFDVFYQAHPSLDRKEGGLGLGLTLARKVVELHSGAIEATSPGRGRGAEFVVRLPIALAGDQDRPAESAAHGAHGGHRRILVVDDNEDAAASLSILLSRLGHEVETAHDGEDAIRAARRFRPQCVLLDIGLPVMNGYDVARSLRALPETRDALVIALTGYSQPSDRERIAASGFDHHLVKPVELSALETVLEGDPGSRNAGPRTFH